MTGVTVNTRERTYNVKIGSGLLSSVGELTSKAVTPCKAVIVSDDIVHGLYGTKARQAYEEAGFEVCEFIVQHGEKFKNIATYQQLLEFATSKEITTTDIFVAFGGGVVGDLAGFAAATYRRGIQVVQLPTTLLAAVDSSVGGKTAVNLNAGKNLVGAIHQPSIVVCDTELLSTLEKSTLSDGFAEVIKYGMICSRDFLSKLEGKELNFENIISKSVSYKARIVGADENDKGKRRELNFGHTAGHAIEKASNYEITHGAAVAIGMYMAAKISEVLGYATEPCADRLKSVLNQYGLKTGCPFSVDELLPHILDDKKRRGDELTLVLLQEIGRCIFHSVRVSDVREIFSLGV